MNSYNTTKIKQET